MASVWLWAFAGSVLQVVYTSVPSWLNTTLYLMMGWFGVAFYFEIASRLSFRALAAIPVGGLIYSIGALVNLLGRPILWPGIFQAHELFHLFVIAASLVHFRFLLTVVVPFEEMTIQSPPGHVAPILKPSTLAHSGRTTMSPLRCRPHRSLLGKNANRGFSTPGTFPPGKYQ